METRNDWKYHEMNCRALYDSSGSSEKKSQCYSKFEKRIKEIQKN